MEQQTAFCSQRHYTVVGDTDAWSSRSVPFYLSFPPGLSLLDPAWKSCKNFESGAYDPPHALHKATALATTALASLGLGLGESQTSTAVPGAKPTPGLILATPTPTADNSEKNAASPSPASGFQDPDPPNAAPTEDNPAKETEPSAIPNFNSAAVTRVIQYLEVSGSEQEDPSNLDDPNAPGGNGGGGLEGAIGHDEGDPTPGAVNAQDAGFENLPAGSNTPSVDIDSPLPSFGKDQIQKAEDGGIVIGSTTIRPGDQTTVDGVQVSVGSGRVVIGDSTVPLAVPTDDLSDPDPVVMAAPNPVIVDGKTVNRLPDGGVIIAGSTYSQGTHTTIFGIGVSVAIDNVVVDGVTHTLPFQDTPTPVLVGVQTIAKASNGDIIIGSSTYSPGSQATVFGTALSVGADNVVVDGSTHTLPTYPASTRILIDGKSITRASNGEVVVGDSTIAPGSQATVFGTTISVGAYNIVVDGSTYPLPTHAPGKPILIDGKSIIRASNGNLVVGDSTIAPGSKAIISGHTVSNGFSSVVVDGSTYALPTNPVPENTIPQSLTLAHGVIISAGGRAATISGTTYSIPSDHRALVVNGKTIAFPAGLKSVFAVAGQPFTANPTGFAVHGHSVLLGGSAITLSGTVVSLGPSGLQIGSSTWPLTPAQETADVGLGGLIMSGFGKGPSATGSVVSGPLAFTGGSPISRDGIWSAVLGGLGMGIGLVVYAL